MNIIGATASARAAKRPTTVNTNWGGVPEPNTFGTHEFMEFAHMIGAKAYINGNLGTGTAGEMADWLKYMTSDQDTTLTRERAANGHKAPWKVPFWAIGNETWGCGGNMRPEYYVDLFRRYATFLKAPQGARPLLIASGGHDEDGPRWTEALMKDGGPNVDAISFHYYTLPSPTHDWSHKGAATGFAENEWISTLANALKMDDYIKANTAIMDKYDPQKRVGFFVDEWGTWYDPEPGRNPGFLYQQNTMRDAVVAAATINIFAQACRPRAHGEHRPDGQRAAGHDPDRRAEDGADADLSRLPHVHPVPGRDPSAVRLEGAGLQLRQDVGACGQRFGGTRQGWPARLRADQSRSGPSRQCHARRSTAPARPRSAARS